MPCYHPFAAVPDYEAGLSDTGRWRYKLEGPYNPEMKKYVSYHDVIRVPCGKCLGCRLDFSRQWADRMMLELESNFGKGLFLTLTYNNENVPFGYVCDDNGELQVDANGDVIPGSFSLRKRDLQLFMKSLRKAFSDRTVRFYACGEYGGRTRRPHYHLIIFNLGLDDFKDLKMVGYNELGQQYFTSEKIERIWKKGFVCLSDVSFKTCAYVSRYCMKKVFDLDAPDGCEPEFTQMSRRPGIGRFYLEDHPDCLNLSKIYLSDSNGSVEVTIPKYFLNQLKLTDPEAFDKLVMQRKEVANDRELLKLQQTSLSYIDLLELEENTRLNKTQILFKRREESDL